MRRTSLAALGCLLVLAGTAVFAQPSPDIGLLLEELGPNATADLARDLQADDLFPASGVHRGIPIWNIGPGMPPGGSLAIVYPTAARAGIELQRLQDAGVQFTNTPTVERIMRVKSFWLELTAQPWFGPVTNSLDAAVRRLAAARRPHQPNGVSSKRLVGTNPAVAPVTTPDQEIQANQELVYQAMRASPDLVTHVSVDENTGFRTYAKILQKKDEPAPGELWCYDVMFGSYVSPGRWCCSGQGSNCWVQRGCGPM